MSAVITDAEAQARAALDRLITERGLPAPAWVRFYGGDYPWLSVHLASVADALAWAQSFGTKPQPDAWLTDDNRLVAQISVVNMAVLSWSPVPVDVFYFPEVSQSRRMEVTNHVGSE